MHQAVQCIAVAAEWWATHWNWHKIQKSWNFMFLFNFRTKIYRKTWMGASEWWYWYSWDIRLCSGKSNELAAAKLVSILIAHAKLILCHTFQMNSGSPWRCCLRSIARYWNRFGTVRRMRCLGKCESSQRSIFTGIGYSDRKEHRRRRYTKSHQQLVLWKGMAVQSEAQQTRRGGSASIRRQIQRIP